MRQVLWNDNWKFWNSKDAFALVWDVPDMAREVTLPHDAMIEETPSADCVNGGNTGFYPGGSYTYVKNYVSNPGDRERNICLKFEGVYMNTFVYVNGQLAANHPYGYTGFYVPIASFLKEEGDNEIRVQVKNNAMPNSRWYTGSGIYRDVYLLEAGQVYLKEDSLHVTTESCDKKDAVINVSGVVRNASSAWNQLLVKIMIHDHDGRLVAEDRKVVMAKAGGEEKVWTRFDLENARLWSEDRPDLYQVTMTLSTMDYDEEGCPLAKEELDVAEDRFGIRKLTLNAKHGLRVNGKEVKLRGACIHHDSGILGAKTYEEAEYRRVAILKKAGFNAIRMSHHPSAPALLRACDELGMYVMDEGFDMWTRGKSDYDYGLYFMDWWKRDITAMVESAFNHPSVILYSIGNEIPEIGTDAGSSLAAEMSDLCHELDPSRFTLAAINGVFAAGDAVGKITADVAGQVKDTDDSVNVNDFMTIMDKYMDKIVVHPEITKRLNKACAATDIAGYNYMTARFGLDAKQDPNRIMVGSETYPPEIAINWAEVKKYPQVIGDFTWTGWDYIGEAGVGIPAYRWGEGGFGAHYPARLAYSGDIDITGFRRPASYFREVVFGLRQKPYIDVQDPNHFGQELIKTPWVISDSLASWTWDGCEDKPVIVEVYAPGDEVELLVNGKSVGRKPSGAVAGYRTLFETVYEPGQIKAVVYEDGEKISEYALETAGQKAEIGLSFDDDMKADAELIYVNMELMDEQGRLVTNADEKLKVTVDGPVKLVGLGSGNPKAEESYLGDEVISWKGRALMILTKCDDEIAKVSVTSESGLKASISI